jgi:hypothetical protein
MTENNVLAALELNAITGEITSRNLTPDEIAEKAKMEQEFLEFENEKLAAIESRTSALAKLAALGLTEEEIAAL